MCTSHRPEIVVVGTRERPDIPVPGVRHEELVLVCLRHSRCPVVARLNSCKAAAVQIIGYVMREPGTPASTLSERNKPCKILSGRHAPVIVSGIPVAVELLYQLFCIAVFQRSYEEIGITAPHEIGARFGNG